ncbi:putative leucine-rich repeat-containing protein DDB_G0290503 [Cotesia glomerata]|uniref:Uncharacterized protein n=1 Tax=Cotesia glomerata TaxID=32391 RepID=A0AAV7IX50_COTGL|nr:putative leucine-rich repeat-containing protein DDB_G0290503 [Cotesia glomerata]KAH0560344.1 hypothetical protein KQX54_003699 [Cotesia glomerata]
MDQESNKGDKTSEVTKQPPERVRCTMSQDTIASYAEMRKSSHPIDTIDTVWNLSSSSSSNTNNLLSHDAQDFLRYQEGQQKLKHIYKVYTSLHRKMTASKKEFAELKTALEKETALNQIIRNKSASALQLTASFNQHINYMNDTLIRNKESAKNLEDMYENEIVKLLNDKENLSKKFDELNQSFQGEDEKYNEEVKNIQLEIAKMKTKNAASEDKLIKLKIETKEAKEKLAMSEQFTANQNIIEDELKNRVEELKHALNEQEKKRIDMMNNFPDTDKIKETKHYFTEKLSLAEEELNKAKSLLNSIREEFEGDVKKYEEQEKLCQDLDKNVEETSSQINQIKNQTDEANLKLKQVNEENFNTKKKIDEKTHDLSLINDKLALETLERNNLGDQVNSLKEAIEKKKEENDELKQKLEEKKAQLTEVEQSKTNTKKDFKEFQLIEESKVVEFQKKLDIQIELKEQALIENEELKADKQKIERDHEKSLKELDDRYNAGIANLEKQMTLNNKLAAELSETQNSILSRENEFTSLEAQIEKDKKNLESKLKKAEEILSKKNESEKQLMEQKNQLEVKINELENECKQLEEMYGNDSKLLKSQSNLELKVQTPEKPIFSSQSSAESTKEQQKSQSLKQLPIPGISSQSSGKKSSSFLLSSDSDDDDIKKKETHDKVDGLLKALRISQTPPSSPEQSLKVTPSPGTAKRSLFSEKK